MIEQALRAWGWTGTVPEIPAQAEASVARSSAASIVSSYWDDHEYRPRRLLPSIQIVGIPWDLPPNVVHILDLDPALVLGAMTKSPELADLSQVSETPALALQRLFGATQNLIRRLGPLAVFNSLVQFALFAFLAGAHYAPTKNQAEHAAKAGEALLREFLPDLSRQMTRIPDRLAKMQRAFQQTYVHADRVRQELEAKGVTPSVLARARRLFGRRTRHSDLARWQRMTVHAMAVDALAAQHGLSGRAVRDQLRLADKADQIGTAWRQFVEHLASRPDAEQQRILTAFVLPTPQPVPPSPAPSAA